MHPSKPIANTAYIIPKYPKIMSFPLIQQVALLTAPKAGRIRIYTSGCPKNQKRC
jgi:hypothetical protein